MKKTQWKDAIRNIRKRLVSYLSIVLVVGLGLGGLFTTRYMGAGIEKKATEYYAAHNFKDFDFVSSYGISEANLAKIKNADKVTDAEGVIQADGSISFDGNKRNVTIISLTERVSVPDVAEGRLPQGRDECMVGEDFAEVEGLKVGDKVRISLTGLTAFKDKMKADMDMNMDMDPETAAALSIPAEEQKEEKKEEPPLYSKEFTITGLMHHPDFLRRKSINTVSLPLSAFNSGVTEGLYTRAFVRIEQPEKTGMFDEKYFKETAETRKEFEALAKELEEDRTKEVKDQANKTIDEKWAEAEKKLADAQAKVDDGEAELNTKLADGRRTLNDLQAELNRRIEDALEQLRNGTMTIPQFNMTINELKEELRTAQEFLNELRAKFDADIKELPVVFDKLKYLLDNYEKRDTDPEYKKNEEEVAQYILDNQIQIRLLVKEANDPEVEKRAKQIDNFLGNKNLEEAITILKAFDVEKTDEEAQGVVYAGKHFSKETLENINNTLRAVDLIRAQFDAAQKKIDEGWVKIKEVEELAREKIYSEKDKYQRMIEEGWARYFAEKNRYETKLNEAVDLLAVNREKAEKKLAEARAEVNKIEKCEWIVLDRKGNAGYVDIKANLDAVEKMGVIFGLLFTVITAIVCFSTLVIIIDEQKTMVGTSKAFGFHKGEVLGKYLVFGVSSAIVGSIAAVIGAFLLSNFVQKRYAASGMYPIGVAQNIITPVPTVFFSLLIIAVTIAATVIACTDILRSPASMLMKGAVLKKEKPERKQKTTASGKSGSLYSRLIIRNMIEDKARVIVTVAIIAFSCMLIGLGISMKLAYDGMMNRQVSDINRFDIRMDMNEDVTAEDEAALVKVLEKNNTDFMPLTYQATVYDWAGRLDGVTVICANPERIGEFYGIRDPKTGEDIPLPDDGILIQKRMHESYGMNIGDKLTIRDKALKKHDAPIKGTFINYVGRTVVLSPAAYKSIFGEVNTTNSYFIKMNGADAKKVEEELVAVSDNISFTASDDFRVKFDSASKLYNIIVYITTGIAILISFMILTNLANIYLTRKKTELTVMRVNGFTIKETKGYLSKESILTTAAGLILGVAVGAILTPLLIKGLQQPDLEFIKSFQPVAWGTAVGLEALFSLIINTLVYRKVKDLNLKDIA